MIGNEIDSLLQASNDEEVLRISVDNLRLAIVHELMEHFGDAWGLRGAAAFYEAEARMLADSAIARALDQAESIQDA